MIIRVLFVCEGTSDAPLAGHMRQIAAESGFTISLTVPAFERLPRVGHKVSDKLQAAVRLGAEFDAVAVHRDADRDGREARIQEIGPAVAAIRGDVPWLPVIPVRMTEAWLLLDEEALRRVAGNPRGKTALGLPPARSVEQVPDPKATLKEALGIASGLRGRRLWAFQQRFPQHRRHLLERLDPHGPVDAVPSWKAFTRDLLETLSRIAA